MFIELISFGYVHNEAEEGHNRPPVADITIDLRQHIRDASSDSVALVEAAAGTLTAFAGSSPRPVTVAIGGATGQRTAPAFVTALSDRLTTNVHHRDLAVSL